MKLVDYIKSKFKFIKNNNSRNILSTEEAIKISYDMLKNPAKLKEFEKYSNYMESINKRSFISRKRAISRFQVGDSYSKKQLAQMYRSMELVNLIDIVNEILKAKENHDNFLEVYNNALDNFDYYENDVRIDSKADYESFKLSEDCLVDIKEKYFGDYCYDFYKQCLNDYLRKINFVNEKKLERGVGLYNHLTKYLGEEPQKLIKLNSYISTSKHSSNEFYTELDTMKFNTSRSIRALKDIDNEGKKKKEEHDKYIKLKTRQENGEDLTPEEIEFDKAYVEAKKREESITSTISPDFNSFFITSLIINAIPISLKKKRRNVS